MVTSSADQSSVVAIKAEFYYGRCRDESVSEARARTALFGAGFSHGYLGFGPLDLPQSVSSVAEGEFTGHGSVLLRMDLQPRDDSGLTSGPGMQALLVMADALHLLGAEDVHRVRIETMYLMGDPWPIPGRLDAYRARSGHLMEQAVRWASPNMEFPWNARASTGKPLDIDVREVFSRLFPLDEISPDEWGGGFPSLDNCDLSIRLANDLPAFGWLYDAVTCLTGEPPSRIEGTRIGAPGAIRTRAPASEGRRSIP